MATIPEALAIAVQHHQAGRLQAAEQLYRQILQVEPDQPEALHLLGVIAAQCGKHKVAVACMTRAIQLKPNFAEALSNLAVSLIEERKLDESVDCCRRALRLKPNYAEAHSNLGNALREQGKLDEAVASFCRALQLKPDLAEAHNNLGNALRDQGKLDEAVASFCRALQLKPDYAEAHWNLATSSLLAGDFERGWAEYEWRWQLVHNRRREFSQPVWDGQPLAGRTILLYADAGFGDALQFVRYAASAKQRGGRVVVECQLPLLPLLGDCPGIDLLIGQGDPLPPFDVWAPLLSLPGILGTTLETIPARVPYLRADPELVQYWRKKLEPLGGFKVGIVWQGNPHIKYNRHRSISLRHFETLTRVEGVRLVSLQKGPGADQLITPAASFPVVDLGQQQETFSDTAAVLMNLDLLISCDTSVPHLAGALGVPVWLALPFIPECRWLLGREDSPWYPHHRLFRQIRPGDWSEVFERIAIALRGLVATRQ